jgi:hypothetical protein
VLLGVWSLVLLASSNWRPGALVRSALVKLERLLSAFCQGWPITCRREETTENVGISSEGRESLRWLLIIATVLAGLSALPYWGKAAAAFTTSLPVFPLSILIAVLLAIGLRLDLRRRRDLIFSSLAIAGLLALRLPSGPLDAGPRRWVHVQPRLMPVNREEYVAAWCGRNLPPGCRLIVPPESSAFRLHAERAVVVDYKCFPFSPQGALEWRRRMTDISGVAYQAVLREKSIGTLSWGYNRRTAADVIALGRRYGAGFFVTRSPRRYEDFAQLFRFLEWKVYRLPATEAGPNRDE